MRKRILSIAMTVLLALAFTVPIFANEVRVQLDGEYVDIEAVIVNDRTLLPVRAITELLGGSVDWDGELRQVTLERGNTRILLTIDNPVAYVNGVALELDVPAQIINGWTKVPLRFIAASFGVDVDFANNTVLITTAPEEDTLPVVADEQPQSELISESAPSSETTLSIISAPNEVRRNQQVTISITGTPNTTYRLNVRMASGNLSTAQGLGDATTDANGVASWTWQIGGATNAQTIRAEISGGGESLRHEMQVIVD